MCRLILPMSMYIGVFSLHHSLTLILPLKNTAFSGSEMPEGRNTDRTCHHDNGFCELPDTQTLLWGGWRERDRKREKRKGGCGIRQPHFYPLGLCGLLVFTCRISINTENVWETEHYIKTEIRARDRHCVLEVCWTRVLMVSPGSRCPYTVWDQDQTHIIFHLPVPNTLTRDAPIDRPQIGLGR